MKTKNNIKKTTIIFQIFAIIFLTLGIIGKVLQTQNYELLLFDRTMLTHLFQICFLIFYLIESLFVIVFIVKTKKKLVLLTYIVLLPLIIIQTISLSVLFSFSSTIELYNYPEFDTTVVIENSSDLLGDYSSVYQTKNNILLKNIAIISGTPCPLGDESLYDVKIENNKIIYTYEDSSSETNKNQFILEYENGRFKEVTN